MTDRQSIMLRWGGAAMLAAIAAVVLWRGAAPAPPPEVPDRPLHAEIERAISGHKVKLDNDQYVVYAGIRAPYEHEDPALFEAALKRNAELVDGKNARLRFPEKKEQDDGDLIAYVFVDGEFINETLVREGLAYVRLTTQVRRFADRLLEAQQNAQRRRLGIWTTPLRSDEKRYPADPKYGNYHRPSCEELTRKPSERLVNFRSRGDALRAGFAPCDKCRP